MITMEELLALLVRQGGSDLHVSVNSPPRIRVDGELLPVEHPALTADDTRRLATSVLSSLLSKETATSGSTGSCLATRFDSTTSCPPTHFAFAAHAWRAFDSVGTVDLCGGCVR